MTSPAPLGVIADAVERDRFLEVVLSDPDLLRDAFDAIVAAEWPTRDRSPRRPQRRPRIHNASPATIAPPVARAPRRERGPPRPARSG